jgi:hypothetical protein
MPRIEDYRFGHLVVDGEEQTRDVIVLPDRVLTNWWRADGHRLVLADLDDVIEELPERLVVGTGAYGQMRPDPKALYELRQRGVEAESAADRRGRTPIRRARPAPHGGRAAPDLPMSEFALESGAFEHAQPIPERHSCEGADVSPSLRWSSVPEGTRSLALIVGDRNAPGGVFTHWVAWGLDPGAEGLGEGGAARGPRNTQAGGE